MLEHLTPYLGAFLIGLSKAGFATGLSMLTTPLVASVVSARFAIGLILPLLVVSDFMTLGVYWKKWNLSLIAWPLVGCLAGIAIGMFFINGISDVWLRRSVGWLGLVLTVLLLIRDIWYPSKTWRPSWWQGAAVGAFAGFASTLAHAAGPIMALYFMAQKLEKRNFVATNALFFTVNNLLKVPPYLASGLITAETLRADLPLVAFIPLGILAGWGLNRMLPQKSFAYLVYGLLFLTSLQLVLR
jgi:uncharacterized membrane protein YfcA